MKKILSKIRYKPLSINKEDEIFVSVDRSNTPSPELTCSLLSKITYYWAQPLLISGYRKPLESKDIWAYPTDMMCENNMVLSHLDWTKKHPLLLKIVQTFVVSRYSLILVKIGYSLFMFLNPILLRMLLQYLQSDENVPSHILWTIVLALFISAMCYSTLIHMSFWLGLKQGLVVRGAVMAQIYQKALKMSMQSKKEFSVGSLVNLMSVDAEYFKSFFWNSVHDLWLGPLQVLVLLIMLCVVLGPFGLLGFLTMVLIIPLNAKFLHKSSQSREEALNQSDKRVKTVHELVQGIKLLKLYSWESFFLNQIDQIRKLQLNYLYNLFKWSRWSILFYYMSPGFVFASHVWVVYFIW